MPYGYSIPSRLQHIQGNKEFLCEEEDEEGIIFGLNRIIREDKLDQYYEYVQKQDICSGSNFYKANIELERIHSRAILDYFNEQLNSYRPYKEISTYWLM